MIFTNDDAYTEFKQLLDESGVDSYNIRISLDSISCNGPVFDISVSPYNDNDEIEKIKDITFIVQKSLLEEYGGFTIISNEENNGYGVGLKPIVYQSPSCGGCDCENSCNECGCKK